MLEDSFNAYSKVTSKAQKEDTKNAFFLAVKKNDWWLWKRSSNSIRNK